jgi:hypothetical protein
LYNTLRETTFCVWRHVIFSVHSPTSGYCVLSHIPMIWRHVKEVQERTSRATSRHFFYHHNVVIQHLVSDHRHLFHSKNICPSSSLLQGKHLPFTPSPLRLNIFRLFVILSLTQLYRYTPEIFPFSTATFKYKYRAPLRRIGQEYSAKVAFSIFQSMKRIQSLPVRSKLKIKCQ